MPLDWKEPVVYGLVYRAIWELWDHAKRAIVAILRRRKP
jgi:hypothetical protein